MRDFTKTCYEELLNEMKKAQYEFVTFEEYLTKNNKNEKTVILRHDVDKSPGKALQIAEMEKMLGERGTFYFRGKEGLFPVDEIKKIAAMGHEIGYHYEDLDKARGNVEAALASFKRNLERLREIVPVNTICMHGSPLSRFDNRDLWNGRDYREFGIIGEPYFDIDFSKVLYLTDTGRRWDGGAFAIRDKVKGQGLEVRGEGLEVRGQRTEDRGQKTEGRKQKTDDRIIKTRKQPRIHSTNDLIKAIRNDQLPEQIMLTIHPQRWMDEWIPWVYELVSQNVKNRVKFLLVRGKGLEVRGEREDKNRSEVRG